MGSIDQHANKPPTIPGQANLAELAAAVRAAHAGVVSAHANAIEHALKAGEALITAKAAIPHKQFGDFLRKCDVGQRQSQRYMRLYQLAVGKNDLKSLLVGLSIEEAIRFLTKPDASAPPKEKKPRKPAQAKAKTTHNDVMAAWLGATPEERTKAINSIGLRPLLLSIPENWWPAIENLHRRSAASS